MGVGWRYFHSDFVFGFTFCKIYYILLNTSFSGQISPPKFQNYHDQEEEKLLYARGGDLPDDYGKNPVVSIRIRCIQLHMMSYN